MCLEGDADGDAGDSNGSIAVVQSGIENEPPKMKPADYYRFVWKTIRETAPQAILLRGPDYLDPVEVSNPLGDLDILVPTNLEQVKSFLKKQGFYRVYKPQTYLERFRFRLAGVPVPYTIDLYKAELWGLGFRLPKNGAVPADARLACLIHAVADGKGTIYFEQRMKGPPWEAGRGIPKFGPVGRALWQMGNTGLLTFYLLLTGVVRPDPWMILRNFYRRIIYRAWQLVKKPGLEVALLGVDGTGKSSLANALLGLPASVKIVYMGPHDYQTRVLRCAIRYNLPPLLQKLAYRYEMLARRIVGWLFAKKGWVVIYDRHPAERLEPWQGSLKSIVKHLLDCLYAWPVDMTFWLTGDYSTIYQRKRELSVPELQAFDQRFHKVLQQYSIPFEKIDVTQNDLDSVTDAVSERILAELHERISIERAGDTLRAALL